MEPISGIASIFSVISLAFQLGQTALGIKRFIETISNAPFEVIRLRDVIFHLHIIADGVTTLLDRQQTLHNEDNSISCDLHHALKTCQNKLELIENVLRRADEFKKGRIVSRCWANLRLACKKGQIEELERQLEQAILILNVVITTNLMSGQMRMTRLLVDKIQSEVPSSIVESQSSFRQLENGSIQSLSTQNSHTIPLMALRENTCHISKIRSNKLVSTVVTTSSSKWSHQSALGVLSLQKEERSKTHRRKVLERTVEAEMQYCIRPSFLSWCFEFRITKLSYGLPQYTLKAIQIMDKETERDLQVIFYDKDLARLQKKLADGTVALNGMNSRGESLLMFAQHCLDEDAAAFLAQQGCLVTRSNVETCASWGSSSEWAFQELCSRADLDDCCVDEIFTDPEDIMNRPSMLEWYITTRLDNTSLDPNEFLGSALLVEADAWACIIDEIGRSVLQGSDLEVRINRRGRWEHLLRRSIYGGANLHYLDQHGLTILERWVEAFHILDAQEIIQKWLQFLESCDVDTYQYILNESQVLQACPRSKDWILRFCCNKTVKIFFDSCRTSEVRVSWWADSKCPGALVIEEFSGLRDGMIDWNWKACWPFSYETHPKSQGVDRRIKSFAQRCHERQSRFERRQAKKERKTRRSQGSTSVMPGSWVF